MKQIATMLAIFIMSIANAQNFDFDCNTEPTLREIREKIVTDFNAQDGVSNVVVVYQYASWVYVTYSVNGASPKSFYWSSPNHDSSQSVLNSGHFGDHTQENFDATLTQFKLRLKDANPELAIFAFNNGPEPDPLHTDFNNGYGDQLPEILETAADEAFAEGLEAQEAFILSLANGASYKGEDSYVIWDSVDNYYHIVTSNVNEGNGYFNILLNDNHHYLPSASGVIGETNFRHLTYHVLVNLWNLTDQTDTDLRGARQTWLRNYAENRGKAYNFSLYFDTEVYRISSDALYSNGTDRNCEDYGADRIEDLTISRFANFVSQWKIDEASL